MTIHISGQVPGEAQNGMLALEDDWTGDRSPDTAVAIVLIERDSVKLKDADQTRIATMKFQHIEPLLSASDAQAARDLLEKACAVRGGEVFTPGVPDTELDFGDEAGELDLDDDGPEAA